MGGCRPCIARRAANWVAALRRDQEREECPAGRSLRPPGAAPDINDRVPVCSAPGVSWPGKTSGRVDVVGTGGRYGRFLAHLGAGFFCCSSSLGHPVKSLRVRCRHVSSEHDPPRKLIIVNRLRRVKNAACRALHFLCLARVCDSQNDGIRPSFFAKK